MQGSERGHLLEMKEVGLISQGGGEEEEELVVQGEGEGKGWLCRLEVVVKGQS